MNTTDLYAMTDDQRLELFLQQWHIALGNQWITSSELVAAYTSPLFWHPFLGTDKPTKLTIRLGILLRKKANQQVGQYRILQSRDRRLKIWMWSLKKVDPLPVGEVLP